MIGDAAVLVLLIQPEVAAPQVQAGGPPRHPPSAPPLQAPEREQPDGQEPHPHAADMRLMTPAVPEGGPVSVSPYFSVYFSGPRDAALPTGGALTVKQHARNELDRVLTHCWEFQNQHSVAGEEWARWRDVLGLPTAVLCGLTSAAAFSQLLGGVVAGWLALLVTVLTAAATYLNPSQKAERHKAFVASFQSLRYEIDMFKEFFLPSVGDAEVIKSVRKLIDSFETLNKSRPEVSAGQIATARARVMQMRMSRSDS